MREVATLRSSPPDGLRVNVSEEDMLDIVGIIAGPGEECRRVCTWVSRADVGCMRRGNAV